jgi:tryptophan-rich sensory protein
MAVAGWLIWRRRALTGAKVALLLFVVQLGLDAIWPGLFFSARHLGLAFGEITLLWLAIVATVMAFWRLSRVAALLMIPCLLWVTFATILNLAIWMMNV